MSAVPEREEIDDTYQWDLDSLFASDEAWAESYETVSERLDELRAYEGRATESADTLVALLETYESVMRAVSDVAAYARMRKDEDTRDDEAQAMATRAQSLASEAASAASFIEPELQDLDREDVAAMVEARPELELYEHYFDDVLRMKPHTRSTEVENLLAELGSPSGSSTAGNSMSALTSML